jgi:signal transduction histidine kinase
MAESRKSPRQLERERREETARRLAFIGTLASGLAHEIRSPLNSLRLNVDLLEEDLDAVAPDRREEFARRLRLMSREIEGLQRLLSEFLAFARPPKMQPVPTDLNQMIDDVIEFEQAAMRQANIEIVRDYQKDIYPVLLDPNQFGRGVILNLLSNARDAIGQHGTITIRTRETEEYIEVRVEDNGGGVAPENESRIFEVFFSTKEHGTGLGLAIARRIVHEHDGELLLENHPGRGASFIVRLPKSKILDYRNGDNQREAAASSQRKSEEPSATVTG